MGDIGRSRTLFAGGRDFVPQVASELTHALTRRCRGTSGTESGQTRSNRQSDASSRPRSEPAGFLGGVVWSARVPVQRCPVRPSRVAALPSRSRGPEPLARATAQGRHSRPAATDRAPLRGHPSRHRRRVQRPVCRAVGQALCVTPDTRFRARGRALRRPLRRLPARRAPRERQQGRSRGTQCRLPVTTR